MSSALVFSSKKYSIGFGCLFQYLTGDYNGTSTYCQQLDKLSHNRIWSCHLCSDFFNFYDTAFSGVISVVEFSTHSITTAHTETMAPLTKSESNEIIGLCFNDEGRLYCRHYKME
jgi:hypothetical protein